MNNLENIAPWIIDYRYLIILPISIIEGPIITLISGFLASLGYLNLWIAYAVVVTGDVIGDCIYYSIGRYGRFTVIRRYGAFVGVTEERLSKMENFFTNNSNKTLIFGKFVHGTGSIMWVAAGVAKMPFKIFVLTNFFTTAIKSFILILIGYYFGSSFKTIGTYFDYIGLVIAIVLIKLYLLATKTTFFDKILRKIRAK